jgi:hypothetical protein
MIVQDHFGGDICKIKIGADSHYFNIYRRCKRQVVIASEAIQR